MSLRIVLPLVLAASALPAPADVIHVPTDASLPAAIDQAADGDVIEIAAGTYTAPAGGFRISNEQKGFTVRAAAGATVVLDGNGTREVLRFQNTALALGGTVVFEGITFRNGFSDTPGLSAGITMQRAQGIFRDCRFEDNVNSYDAGSGGAMQVSADSTATLERCEFEDNWSGTTGAGLGVADHASVVIRDSRFLRNRTNPPGHQPNFSAGGAIHVGNSALEVVRTRFEANETGYAGGAIFAQGFWDDSQGGARVTVDNCTFVANAARRNQPASASIYPTEGGALHAEDLATVVIRDSRFLENQSNNGGAVNLYRADVTIEESVFRGNRATGGETLGLKSAGGAISAISNDVGDGSTGSGAFNRPPARLHVVRSLLQGRHGATTVAGDIAGCLNASGDTNRVFGLGVPADGTLAENQAEVTLEGVVFHDCDVAQTSVGGSGYGGAMMVGVTRLVLRSSLMLASDAVGAPSGGGGIVALAFSDVTVEDTAFAANSAGSYGGALLVQGAHAEISASAFLHNEMSPGQGESCFTSYGAAIFGSQFEDNSGELADADATGFVTASLFSENVGLPIFDDDREPGPINDLRYAGNSFHAPSFAGAVYSHALNPPPAICVSGTTLGAHVVTRDGGPSTPKGTLPGGSSPPNVDLGVAPAYAALVAAPTRSLATNAAGDPPPPEPAFLGMAWLGAATLNGAPLVGPTALAEVPAGTYMLAAGGGEETVVVPEPAAALSGLAVGLALGLRGGALARRRRDDAG